MDKREGPTDAEGRPEEVPQDRSESGQQPGSTAGDELGGPVQGGDPEPTPAASGLPASPTKADGLPVTAETGLQPEPTSRTDRTPNPTTFSPFKDWCSVWRGRIHAPLPESVKRTMQHAVEDLLGDCLPSGPTPESRLCERLISLATARFPAELHGPGITHAAIAADLDGAFRIAFQAVRAHWVSHSMPQRDLFIWVGYDETEAGACADCLGGRRPLAFEHLVQLKGVMGPHCYRCPWNQARPQRESDARLYRSCGWECLFQLDEAIVEAGDRLAGVIMSPLIQPQGGMVMFPPGYLRGVQERCESARVPFIADESLSAFGRTGSFFACEQEAVRPDLLILGDSLSMGLLPMGAVLGTSEFPEICPDWACRRCPADPWKDQARSVAAATALGVLEVIEGRYNEHELAELAQTLRVQAHRFWEIPFVGDVRCCGMVAVIEIVGNWKTRKPFPGHFQIGSKIAARARESGVAMPHWGDRLVLSPPIGCTTEDIVAVTDLIWDVTTEVLAQETPAAHEFLNGNG